MNIPSTRAIIAMGMVIPMATLASVDIVLGLLVGVDVAELVLVEVGIVLDN